MIKELIHFVINDLFEEKIYKPGDTVICKLDNKFFDATVLEYSDDIYFLSVKSKQNLKNYTIHINKKCVL